MAFISCNECYATISEKAESCPKCGNSAIQSEPKRKAVPIFTIIGLVILCAWIWVSFNNPDNAINKAVEWSETK